MKMRRHIRTIVSTTLVGAMVFFAPSTLPIRAIGPVSGGVSLAWLSADAAFAQVPPPPPAPTAHSHTPVWPWVVIGCAGSIVLSAVVADFRDNRQLTTPEAWTCGLLYWIPMPYQPRPAARAKG